MKKEINIKELWELHKTFYKEMRGNNKLYNEAMTVSEKMVDFACYALRNYKEDDLEKNDSENTLVSDLIAGGDFHDGIGSISVYNKRTNKFVSNSVVCNKLQWENQLDVYLRLGVNVIKED